MLDECEPAYYRGMVLSDGFDTGILPCEERAAIHMLDLREDAYKRALRGVRQLEVQGPIGWRLEMMRIENRVVSSRVNMRFASQYPLALAYRRVPEMQGHDGRPDHGRILDFLRLRTLHGVKSAQYCGFLEKDHRVGEVYIPTHVDCHFLNDGWGRVLGDLPWSEANVPPYSTERLRLMMG